jgi:hypothetical protein
VAAGGVGVLIPMRYVPLLQGRWDSVNDQRMVFLDNKKFWDKDDSHWQPRYMKHIPFNVHDTLPSHVPFVLPGSTKFLDAYSDYRVSPDSSSIAQLVAIVQVVLSIRQLYSYPLVAPLLTRQK